MCIYSRNVKKYGILVNTDLKSKKWVSLTGNTNWEIHKCDINK